MTDSLIEMKKIKLQLAENKLKISEDFRQRLNEKQLKKLMDAIKKLKTELSSEQSREAGRVLPINIEKKIFLT